MIRTRPLIHEVKLPLALDCEHGLRTFAAGEYPGVTGSCATLEGCDVEPCDFARERPAYLTAAICERCGEGLGDAVYIPDYDMPRGLMDRDDPDAGWGVRERYCRECAIRCVRIQSIRDDLELIDPDGTEDHMTTAEQMLLLVERADYRVLPWGAVKVEGE